MLSRAFIGGIVQDYLTQKSDVAVVPLTLQSCDYAPLILQTKSVYDSLSTRQTGLSYEERVDTLSDRKMALRNFHDERKIEASENPDDFKNHRREAAIAGLEKERKAASSSSTK